MLNKEVMYGYGDIAIIPCVTSTIEHRADCNVLKEGKLPIFAAPMSTVINEDNFDIFENNGINAILPRNINYLIRTEYMLQGKWVAFSLSEFDDIVKTYDSFEVTPHILIDVANGHMQSILQAVRYAKTKFGSDGIIIMAGNIANPFTYMSYNNAGVDYVRVGIGGGEGCISSTQTAIHNGMVTLLDDIVKVKHRTPHSHTKIIADGGIRDYADVIKALALGADYVMIGGLFSRLIESCAKTYYYDKEQNLHILNPLDGSVTIKEQEGVFSVETHSVWNRERGDNDNIHIIYDLYKVFYGMASKRGQEDMFGQKVKTSEGCVKNLHCLTNIDKWVANMKAYLASAMSYCDINDVSDFNENNVTTRVMSNTLQNSINK